MSRRRRANARHMTVPAVLDGLVLAAFAGAMLTTGGATLDAAAMAALFFGGTIVAIAGSVIVAWTVGDAHPSHHVMAILLGSLATSLVLLLGCVITGTLAAKVFLAWSALVLAAGAWTLRSAPEVERRDGLDVLAIVAIAILVAALCHHTASTLPSIQATGLVPIWSDYSIHGTEIAQFGDPHVQGLSSFLLAGQPLVFYHYASYMLPAAAAGVMSLPPWGVAASLLLPYGLLLMSLAVYAFARMRLGAAAATIVPAALLLVPDASAYGLRNGFFGFHWLLFTNPGSGYGLSAAFTALTLMVIWRSLHRSACFWLGIFVTAAAFEFRVQIFLLLAPAMAASLLCETAFVRRHARALILAVALTAITVIICLVTWHGARDAWLRFSALRPFLEAMHSGMSPTAYDGAYAAIDRRYGPLVGTTLGVLALIPAALGALALALPIACAAAIRRTGWCALDTFPIWCVAAWLGLVLVAPMASHGDYVEFQHRPFVLIYTSAVVWTLLFVERGLPAAGPSAARLRLALSTTLVAGIAITALARRHEDPARPRFAWGMSYFHNRLERGFIDAAAFVRTHAARGDTFALIPTDPTSRLDDDATRLAALAGVPAYLARASIQASNGPARRLVVEQRLSELHRVATASDANAAFETLRTVGVDFLVTLGKHGPSFDPSGSRAAFRAAGAAVYQIGLER
jgi:hypothetical protein